MSVGLHVVSVKYADIDIRGSPYHVEVFDPHQVWVSNIPQTAVSDQPVNFDGLTITIIIITIIFIFEQAIQ